MPENKKSSQPTPYVKSGSSMSARQLAQTVRADQKVSFRTSLGTISGYLCGMDDFHWMVVSSEGHRTMVHKGSAPIIELHDLSTYDDEPLHDLLQPIVGTYQDFIMATFFGGVEQERRVDA